MTRQNLCSRKRNTSDFSLTCNDELLFRTQQRSVDYDYDNYPDQGIFSRPSAHRSRSFQPGYHRTTVETIDYFLYPCPQQPVRFPSTHPRTTPFQSYQPWKIRYNATSSSTSSSTKSSTLSTPSTSTPSTSPKPQLLFSLYLS